MSSSTSPGVSGGSNSSLQASSSPSPTVPQIRSSLLPPQQLPPINTPHINPVALIDARIKVINETLYIISVYTCFYICSYIGGFIVSFVFRDCIYHEYLTCSQCSVSVDITFTINNALHNDRIVDVCNN